MKSRESFWDERNNTVEGIAQCRDKEQNCYRDIIEHVIGEGIKYSNERHAQPNSSFQKEGKVLRSEYVRWVHVMVEGCGNTFMIASNYSVV